MKMGSVGFSSQIDSINSQVAKKLLDRAMLGHEKYGTTMDRKDLTAEEWIAHLQEELMDAAVYCEKILQIIDGVYEGTGTTQPPKD